MAILISRNDAGNCINFIGSSNPTYWNAVLEGEVSERDTNLVNVINSVRTIESEATVYEFYEIPYTEFADKEGNAFEDASECAQYITDNANVSGNQGSFIFSEVDTLDAVRDATNTTVLFSNGDIFAVNSLHADAQPDGTITIRTVRGDKDVYSALRFYNTTVSNGTVVMQNLDTAVNRLNEVLSGAAIGSDGGSTPGEIATAPESTNTFTVYGDRIVESGTAGYTSTAEAGNFDTSNGIYSNQLISEPGEFFEFEQTGGWANTGSGLTFGLFDETMYDVSVLNEDVAGNLVKSALRLRINNTPFIFKDPNNNYEKFNEAGFVNSPSTKTKFRVGLDANNRAYIAQDVGNDIFEVIGRTQLPVPTGNEFRLIVIFPLANELEGIRNFTTNLLDSSPALTWYYIESPDGSFNYPLFTSADQANYVDEEYGTAAPGTGASHQELFVDEQPSQSIWHMPSTYAFEEESSAPAPLSGVVWNEIVTGDDANYVPTAYGPNVLTVNENVSVNYPIVPAGDANTYSVTGIPSGLLFNGSHLVGTAPEVTGDNVTNPNDVFTITVVRGNDYGSSTGTLTLTVNNTTAPSTALSGFTWDNTSTPLINSTTMGEGSVVSLDDTIEEGKRFIIDEAWVETNILPNLTAVNDKVYIGIPKSSADWSDGVDASDFEMYVSWERTGASAIQNSLFGQSGTNALSISSLTDAVYDFGFEVDNGTTWVFACDTSDMNTEPSPSDGGSFTRIEGQAFAGPHTIVIGTVSAETTLSTSGIGEITAPVAPTNLTSWTKALDFSGSEYAVHVNNSMLYQPLQMGGLANTVPAHSTPGYTANNASSRPWETVVIFKSDGYAGNQMIWNQGEGSTSGDDNIFVNVTANGTVNFGWGRSGVGYNQCQILTNISTSTWYAVYVASTGERLSGNNASAANLADCFDIRTMSSADSFAALSSNLSVAANWVVTGVRMDRTFAGDFTVGGRGTGYSFRGKVASMITHCLKAGVLMPDATEIKLMITDPNRWEADYLIGQTYRRPTYLNNSTNYQKQTSAGFESNQMWFMGDGTPDAFPNINNEQRPNWVNYTYLVMTNMVSNDIETVSIPGLT